MIPGLYTAATGMIAVEQRQDIIANNLANAATPGYKRLQPVQLGFYEVLSPKMIAPFHFNREAAPAGGVKSVESFSNLAPGSLRITEDPLSLAVTGPGYVVVNTPQGERYTRDGHFTMDGAGELATSEGYKVLSVTGNPIDVSGVKVTVSQDGMVQVDGADSGQIQMVEFQDPTRLERSGDNFYRASDALLQQSTPAAETTLVQGALEMSNVQLPVEMTSMMLGMRAYEANQKVIQAIDGATSRLIDQVAAQ
jgi:flagellar basal-body rod protein FlgG